MKTHDLIRVKKKYYKKLIDPIIIFAYTYNGLYRVNSMGEKLFKKYNIIEEIENNGYFKITSKQINEYREVRLMTKFNNSVTLPDLFKQHNIFILPITSNSYLVAKFKAYEKFENESINVIVENYILEIDGGYEGFNSLALTEAKNYLSDDFMVRQLYYPDRLWKSKISKPVRPIYVVYSNGIFNVYEYRFKDDNDYGYIEFVNSKRYSIEDTEIEIQDIKIILDNINCVDEPEIPFPQADSFKRVINLCELLEDEEKTKKETKTEI